MFLRPLFVSFGQLLPSAPLGNKVFMQQLFGFKTNFLCPFKVRVLAQVIALALKADAYPVLVSGAGNPAEAAGVVGPAFPVLQPFHARTVHKVEQIVHMGVQLLPPAATAGGVSGYQAVLGNLHCVTAFAAAQPVCGAFPVPPFRYPDGCQASELLSGQILQGGVSVAGFASAAPDPVSLQIRGSDDPFISAVTPAEPGAASVNLLSGFHRRQHTEALAGDDRIRFCAHLRHTPTDLKLIFSSPSVVSARPVVSIGLGSSFT